MARPAKPWYWKARKTWCVYHKGKRVHLGPDRAESLRQYHETMAKPQQKRQPVPGGSVVAILDDFLTWTEENRTPKTYTRYRDFILSFVSEGCSGLIQSIRHRDDLPCRGHRSKRERRTRTRVVLFGGGLPFLSLHPVHCPASPACESWIRRLAG